MILQNNPDLEERLKEENLYYFTDKNPGYFRQKASKESFDYYDLEGKRIRDKKILERVNNLIIPPAWERVWVSPKKNGHLQATGIDDKGRKQYIYHPEWVKIFQENKFSKMIDFGLSLPKIRQKIAYDLRIKKLEKRKILATIVWLLEHTFIRIGNEEYSRENKSFGLTTLRSKHVKVYNDEIVFAFKGKSGVNNVVHIKNPTVVKTIKHCVDLPGYELFQFIDEDGNRHVIDSQDVNNFLRDITKDNFSAKDFRTWGATNLSANNFYKLGDAENKIQLKKNIFETIKRVATHLNNTVKVCRNYYVHPTVIDTYQKKVLVPHFQTLDRSRTEKIRGLTWDEFALIKLLKKYPPSLHSV